MFFLFLLKERGFPITDIFEKEIKDIPTNRFSKDFDETYKTIYYEYMKKRDHVQEKSKKKKSCILDPGNLYSGKPRCLSEPNFYATNIFAHETEEDSVLIPLNTDPVPDFKRPNIVPHLNLNPLKQGGYESSSDEDAQDSDDTMNTAERINNLCSKYGINSKNAIQTRTTKKRLRTLKEKEQ
jgi:hypothetical protein